MEGGTTGAEGGTSFFDDAVDAVPGRGEGLGGRHVGWAAVDEVSDDDGGGGLVSAHEWIIAQMFDKV